MLMGRAAVPVDDKAASQRRADAFAQSAQAPDAGNLFRPIALAGVRVCRACRGRRVAAEFVTY
jgi:hypothetical protein